MRNDTATPPRFGRTIVAAAIALCAASGTTLARQPDVAPEARAAPRQIFAAEVHFALHEAGLTPDVLADAALSAHAIQSVVDAVVQHLQDHVDAWRDAIGHHAAAKADLDDIRRREGDSPRTSEYVLRITVFGEASRRKQVAVGDLFYAALADLPDDKWGALDALIAERKTAAKEQASREPVGSASDEELDRVRAHLERAVRDAVSPHAHEARTRREADRTFANILHRMTSNELTDADMDELDRRTREFLQAPFGRTTHTWRDGVIVFGRLDQPWWLIRPDQDQRLEIRDDASGRLITELVILRHPNRPFPRSTWSDYVHALGPATGDHLAIRAQLFDLAAPDPDQPIAEARSQLPIEVVPPETRLRIAEPNETIRAALTSSNAALTKDGNLLLNAPAIDEAITDRLAVGLLIEIHHGAEPVGRAIMRPYAAKVNPLTYLVDAPGLDDASRPIPIEWTPGFDWRQHARAGSLQAILRGEESVAARDAGARTYWAGEVHLPILPQ